MFTSLIDRFQKLFAVKSIITIALTVVFCKLCLSEMISSDQFMAIFTMVIGFYFGTQAEKNNIEAAVPLIEDTAAEIKPQPEETGE